MLPIIERYRCPVCQTVKDRQEQAEECLKSHVINFRVKEVRHDHKGAPCVRVTLVDSDGRTCEYGRESYKSSPVERTDDRFVFTDKVPEVEKLIHFACPLCGWMHDTEQEARTCEAAHPRLGRIVKASYHGYFKPEFPYEVFFEEDGELIRFFKIEKHHSDW